MVLCLSEQSPKKQPTSQQTNKTKPKTLVQDLEMVLRMNLEEKIWMVSRSHGKVKMLVGFATPTNMLSPLEHSDPMKIRAEPSQVL